jgi:hypothetical protein
MKHLALISIVVYALIGCKKDDKLEPCNLPALSGKIFVGGVGLCNAQPGFQMDFDASTLITYKDSLLYISLQSMDSTIQWSYFDSARIECIYLEGNLSYELFTLSDGTETGFLSHGTSLFYRIKNDPCSASSFSGWVE